MKKNKRDSISSRIWKNGWKISFLLLAIIVVFMFSNTIISIIVSLILIFLGAFSTIYKRFIDASIGFELVTFATIVLCAAHGSIIGFIASIIMVILGAFLINKLCMVQLMKIAGYAAVCLVMYISGGMFGIVALGIAMSLLFNIIMHGIYVLGFGFNPGNSAISFVLNMMLNIFLFVNLGEATVGLL